MVGTKLRTVQWPSIDLNTCRGVNTDRYLKKGLVGQHSMESYERDVVFSGNEKPHKCLKTFSHKTGCTNILENHEAQSHSSRGVQHGSFDIAIKYGGNPESKISTISKRNIGSSSSM